MENILCVYHSGDNDGKFSGAVVKTAYPEAVCVGWNYGKPLSMINLQNKYNTYFDTVIICDLPLFQPIEEFEHFATEKNVKLDRELTELKTAFATYKLLWFDHHIGNQVQLIDRGVHKVPGRFSIKNSAAKNVYDYFVSEGQIFARNKVIDYVDTYDCWKKENGSVLWDDALKFNFGSSGYNINSIQSLFFCTKNLRRDAINWFLAKGKSIKEHIENNANCLKENIDEKTINGYNWKFVNVTSNKSYTAELLNDDKSILSAWSFSGGKYWHSIRTKNPDIDLSEIAKKYGGGGHRSAAGFNTTERMHEVDLQ